MTPQQEARARRYAALVGVMEHRREIRRAEGRGLRPGDLVQDHIGGEIKEVTEVWSGGEYFEAKARERARLARK